MQSKKDKREYHRKYRAKNREKRRKWNRDWIRNNRDQYNASKYIYRQKMKIKVLAYYSNEDIRCAKCGEDDIDVLNLDHINNDGAEHRRKAGIAGRNSTGMNSYEAIARDGFPDGLQVLCANCNLKKEIERKRKKRLSNPFYAKRVGELKEVMPDAK